MFKINIASIIGIVLAIFIYKKVQLKYKKQGKYTFIKLNLFKKIFSGGYNFRKE